MPLSFYFMPENIFYFQFPFHSIKTPNQLLSAGQSLFTYRSSTGPCLRLAQGLIKVWLLMLRSNPVPEFKTFDSYYLTWYDSSHGTDGPYGEPLQEGLSGGFSPFYEEAGDGFLSGYWYSGNRETEEVELACNGDGNWEYEYASYFGSGWGEDMVPRGYGDGESELCNIVEKADEGEQPEGSFSSFADDMEGGLSVKQWSGYHLEFEDGINDCYSFSSKQNKTPARNNEEEDPWSMGLWESIFGYWPCLQSLDEEPKPDFLITYYCH